MLARALLCLVAFLAGADALRLPAAPHARRHAPVRMDGTEDRIKEMIEQNKCAQTKLLRVMHQKCARALTMIFFFNCRIMLFMKGNKMFPQCGFSNTAVMILKSIPAAADFETFDVLSDQSIREGVKTYSNWPTIPQLYIDGEFLGGCDIMIEMYQNGELQEEIEKAAAS